MKKLTPILIVASVVMLCALGIAKAAYPSLGSGYAVDSNFHGINVPPGSEVIVTAYTTDAEIDQVTFLWKNPGGNTVWTEVDASAATESELYDGHTVYSFNGPSHFPDVYGDWGVQALFQGPDGKTKEGIELVVAIKATSFFVIPDIPVLGTVGSLAAMLMGLGLFIKRKK